MISTYEAPPAYKAGVPEVDIAEVASEVVRVMAEEGLEHSIATMQVLTLRKLDYGHAVEIGDLAQKIFDAHPEFHHHIKWRRRERMHRTFAPLTYIEASHRAIALHEEEG